MKVDTWWRRHDRHKVNTISVIEITTKATSDDARWGYLKLTDIGVRSGTILFDKRNGIEISNSTSYLITTSREVQHKN